MPFNVKSRGAPFAHRQIVKLPGEYVHLTAKVDLHNAFPAGIKDVIEALVRIAEPAINPRHRRLALRVDEELQHLIDKVVPGAACDRPVGKALIAGNNFLII
jgi:hypothetical protein